MLDFLLMIILFIVGLVLGFYLLLSGRQKMAVTTAIICLAGTGSLLALIFLRESNAWELTKEPNWLLLGITVAAGIVGGILGARLVRTATAVVGFFAGGYMGLWFYDVAHHIVVDIANWSEQRAFWIGVLILIGGGLIGLFLTRRSEAISVILISVFVGTDIIIRALGLSPQSSFTAVVAISLALLGLVVQYAQYMREIKAERRGFFSETTRTPAPELFDLSEDH